MIILNVNFQAGHTYMYVYMYRGVAVAVFVL